MLKPISISLSPNTEKDDIFLALRIIFQPWHWKTCKSKRGDSLSLEDEFKKYLGLKYAFSFNSGRSALMAILKSLRLKKDDEVLLQAFTCNASVNPIIWSGLKPVFVDCYEETFNIDLEDLKKKINPKTRLVIVQHTFGLAAEMNEILKICKENNLILIEDCAHSLGAKYDNKKIGTFGQAAFFSFSRDKVISSVYGGMAVTNNPLIGEQLKNIHNNFNYPSSCWILQQLMHPILMNWLILPSYLIFGKYILVLFQWLHILSKAVHFKEKRGLKPAYFPKKLPFALALLACHQFKKMEKFNNHRIRLAQFYRQELKNTCFQLPPEKEQIYLRFSLKHHKAHHIIRQAWRKNILIGDWYDKVIAPHDTKLDKMNYLSGSCPKAEKLCQITLNLPTHINISQKEAKKIIDFLNNFINRDK